MKKHDIHCHTRFDDSLTPMYTNEYIIIAYKWQQYDVQFVKLSNFVELFLLEIVTTNWYLPPIIIILSTLL